MDSLRNGGLEVYLRDLQELPSISEEEAVRFFQRAAEGDAEAKERILFAHLSLVVRISYKYTGYGLPLADLVSEGNLGLLRAVELFDPKHGVAFTAYAGVWIKQRLHRAITAQAQVVRIPVWRSQRLRKLDRLQTELSAELGRESHVGDWAERVGLSEKEMAGIVADRVRVNSIDIPGEAGGPLAMTVDATTPAPDENMAQQELNEEIISALHELDDTELQILSLKFGLLNEEPESYRQMAPRFGRSREWIRRIGEEALAKVGQSLRAAGNLPRSLIQHRRENARKRLEILARKPGVVAGKLSLFQVALTQWVEPVLTLI